MTACLRCGAAVEPEPEPEPAWAAVSPPGADPWRASTEGAWAQATAAPPWATDRPAPIYTYQGKRNVRYATWWERVKATVIDVLLATVVGLFATLVIGDLAFELGIPSLVMSANLVFLQGFTGQTVGKRIIGIMVVRAKDEGNVGFFRNLLRQVAHCLDSLVLFLGYFLPLVDKKKRTLADIICRTVVVS